MLFETQRQGWRIDHPLSDYNIVESAKMSRKQDIRGDDKRMTK